MSAVAVKLELRLLALQRSLNSCWLRCTIVIQCVVMNVKFVSRFDVWCLDEVTITTLIHRQQQKRADNFRKGNNLVVITTEVSPKVFLGALLREARAYVIKISAFGQANSCFARSHGIEHDFMTHAEL